MIEVVTAGSPIRKVKRCLHHEREHNALRTACRDKGILLDKFKEREREERSAGCGPELALSLEIFNALD